MCGAAPVRIKHLSGRKGLTHTLAQVQKNPHHPHISRDPHVTSTYCLYSISFWFLKYYCTVQYILAKKKDHAPCVPLILVHGTRLAAHCYTCVTHSIKTTSLKASVATHTQRLSSNSFFRTIRLFMIPVTASTCVSWHNIHTIMIETGFLYSVNVQDRGKVVLQVMKMIY